MRFAGHIMLQARTVRTAAAAVEARDEPVVETALDIMSLLGCLLLAGPNDVLLDSTLGERDLASTRRAVELLGLRDKVRWVHLPDQQTLDAGCFALEVVSRGCDFDQLLSADANRDWRLDQAAASDADEWIAQCDGVVQSLQGVLRDSTEARDLASHLL